MTKQRFSHWVLQPGRISFFIFLHIWFIYLYFPVWRDNFIGIPTLPQPPLSKSLLHTASRWERQQGSLHHFWLRPREAPSNNIIALSLADDWDLQRGSDLSRCDWLGGCGADQRVEYWDGGGGRFSPSNQAQRLPPLRPHAIKKGRRQLLTGVTSQLPGWCVSRPLITAELLLFDCKRPWCQMKVLRWRGQFYSVRASSKHPNPQAPTSVHAIRQGQMHGEMLATALMAWNSGTNCLSVKCQSGKTARGWGSSHCHH